MVQPAWAKPTGDGEVEQGTREALAWRPLQGTGPCHTSSPSQLSSWLPLDGDFQPHEESDDEETIEVEEQQEGNDSETRRREIELLKQEGELPLEELLQSLPPQILENSCSPGPSASSSSADDGDTDEDEAQGDTNEEEEEEEMVGSTSSPTLEPCSGLRLWAELGTTMQSALGWSRWGMAQWNEDQRGAL